MVDYETEYEYSEEIDNINEDITSPELISNSELLLENILEQIIIQNNLKQEKINSNLNNLNEIENRFEDTNYYLQELIENNNEEIQEEIEIINENLIDLIEILEKLFEHISETEENDYSELEKESDTTTYEILEIMTNISENIETSVGHQENSLEQSNIIQESNLTVLFYLLVIIPFVAISIFLYKIIKNFFI